MKRDKRYDIYRGVPKCHAVLQENQGVTRGVT